MKGGERGAVEARLALVSDGFGPQPVFAADFELLARLDFDRKIPVRAKIHICRACRRCEPALAALA